MLNLNAQPLKPEELAWALDEAKIAGDAKQKLTRPFIIVERVNGKDIETYQCTFTACEMRLIYSLVEAHEVKNYVEASEALNKRGGQA